MATSSIAQNTSHFVLPLPLWQQPVSYRTAKYEGFTQRGKSTGVNRDEDDEDEGGGGGGGGGGGDKSGMSGQEDGGLSEDERRRRQRRKEKRRRGRSRSRRRSLSRGGSVRSESVVLGPDEYHQYRIAGMPVDRELPGGNFPHSAAPKGFLDGSEDGDDDDEEQQEDEEEGEEDEDEEDDDSDGNGGKSTGRAGKGRTVTVDHELSKLNPPVYLPGGNPTRKSALRLRHLGVITTILHRCLMEGDYVRAGRAWGLILRDDFGGHSIDVRTGGRWGVGAEILLWKDQSLGQRQRRSQQSGNMNMRMEIDMEGGNKTVEGERNGSSGGKRKWFTRAGFEKAREYYDRLILHYPYRKMAPNALSPLDFYPTMFGLWISLVQEESRVRRETAMEMAEEEEEEEEAEEDDIFDRNNFNNGYDNPFDEYAPADDRMSISSDLPTRSKKRQRSRKVELILESRAKELEEAQQIASQIDELVVSPPYSDSHEILRLRAMISLWIGDLLVSSVSVEDDLDANSDDGYGERRDKDGDLDLGFGDSRRDLERAQLESAKEKRNSELEKANVLFEKAKTRRMRAQSSMG